ncbi:hypothetical protein C7M84_007184 [Penaeus vannamei]|uniref:Uncharacterized protein n=1 Tax=Penaeus vannamei TaxID=6689 RepID=A0A423TD28_PENVA|nr:hypothetical protein C7M84_007184 [Penaeus vannamei]
MSLVRSRAEGGVSSTEVGEERGGFAEGSGGRRGTWRLRGGSGGRRGSRRLRGGLWRDGEERGGFAEGSGGPERVKEASWRALEGRRGSRRDSRGHREATETSLRVVAGPSRGRSGGGARNGRGGGLGSVCGAPVEGLGVLSPPPHATTRLPPPTPGIPHIGSYLPIGVPKQSHVHSAVSVVRDGVARGRARSLALSLGRPPRVPPQTNDNARVHALVVNTHACTNSHALSVPNVCKDLATNVDATAAQRIPLVTSRAMR